MLICKIHIPHVCDVMQLTSIYIHDNHPLPFVYTVTVVILDW